MTNIHREINIRLRAIKRAKDRTMAAMEAEINARFVDGRETAQFRFDALDASHTQEIDAFLTANNLHTDYWSRGLFALTKEQALTLGKLVEEYNAPWIYEVTRDMDDYTACPVKFSPATGSEHTISVAMPSSNHYNDSWQWN